MNDQLSLNIQKNVEYLIFEGKIGNHKFSGNDIKTVHNHLVERKFGYKNYHFEIKIPYCGKKLPWEIMFDPEDSCEIPDFIFHDELFLFDPDIDDVVKKIPEWEVWNIKEPNSLVNLLNRLLSLLRQNQVERLNEQLAYLDYKSEYEELVKHVQEKNVEVYIETKDFSEGRESGSITFLIFIPIDFSTLPEYLQRKLKESMLEDPGEDFAYLQISFVRLDKSQVKTSLQLSPRADQILGDKLKVPKYKKDLKICDYVIMIEHIILENIEVIANQYRARNEFVSTFATRFCTSVIEYDTKLFRKIVFQYEFDGYECLVKIALGINFPLEKPKIQLCSIFCQEGRTCQQNFTGFPYDTANSIPDIVSNIIKALPDALKSFKNHKH